MDNYVIKLTGKAELPEPISIGSNYDVALSGAITSETISDNDDGSKTHVFTFKPVKVEVLNEKGKTIKARDPRSYSQKLRAYLYRSWENDPQGGGDSEAYHDKVYKQIFLELEDIISRAK